MRTDMHVHSIYSDGEYSPLELLKMCKETGISIVSITDHNSLDGAKEALLNNPYDGIRIIPGVELSTKYEGGKQHILGYGIDLNNEKLSGMLKAQREDNVRRVEILLHVVEEEYKFKFKDEDIEAIFSAVGNIARPAIAKLLVEYGYSNNAQEAFKLYLDPVKKKVDKERVYLTAKDAIEYIVGAGGIATIAHPVSLKKDIDELEEYLKELISYGLRGMEVYHSDHTLELMFKYDMLSKKLGLLQSGGSDYHGPVIKPSIELGSGRNNNLNITRELSIIPKLKR